MLSKHWHCFVIHKSSKEIWIRSLANERSSDVSRHTTVQLFNQRRRLPRSTCMFLLHGGFRHPPAGGTDNRPPASLIVADKWLARRGDTSRPLGHVRDRLLRGWGFGLGILNWLRLASIREVWWAVHIIIESTLHAVTLFWRIYGQSAWENGR